VAKKGEVMEGLYGICFLVVTIWAIKTNMDKKLIESKYMRVQEDEIYPLLKRIDALEYENDIHTVKVKEIQ
jgi:hypothetical protein